MTPAVSGLPDDVEAPFDDNPKIFPHSFQVPAGLPWEQIRAAGLEARLTPPIPISELAMQVRRLGSWKPGQPARFAAFYARRTDIGDGIAERILIDGAPVLVRFEPEGKQAQRRLIYLAAAGTIAVSAALLFTGVSVALAHRADAQIEMKRLERGIQARNRALAIRRQDVAEARDLDSANLLARDLDHVLADLAWTEAAKVPELRLFGWYWDKGYMVVEARSSAPFPSADRSVRRNDRPTRPGVWLYGISPATALRNGS